MNEIITEDYFPGKGCDCEARSSYECGCEGADWTPKEVYDLRGEVVALKAFAETTSNLANEAREEIQTELEMWRDGNIFHEIHRNELEKVEQERDESREEAQKSKAYKRVLKVTNENLKRERDEAREGLEEETKFHHRTHLELVETQCKLLDINKERDEARKEAHRFRSLYYAKSGINKSASAFPWEDAK